MIVVSGEIEINPSDTAKIMDAATTMMAETRREAGCHSYAFYQSLEKPGLYRVFEEWESLEHLQAHFETAHMATWRKALSDISVYRREIKRYEVSAIDAP